MMFTAPPEQTLEYTDTGIEGAARFLRRLWKLVQSHVGDGRAPSLEVHRLDDRQKEVRRKLYDTLVKVSDDIGRRNSFNTAIAAMMELVNVLQKFEVSEPQDRAVMQEALDVLVAILSPIVPHICHALWRELGHEGAVIDRPWPAVDEGARAMDRVMIVVQVNGKLRGRLALPAGLDGATVQAAALADPSVSKFIGGKPLRKAIHVPDKLLNLVI